MVIVERVPERITFESLRVAHFVRRANTRDAPAPQFPSRVFFMSSSTSAHADLPPPPVALNLEEAIERMGDKEVYLEIARYFASHLEQTLADLGTALRENNVEDATRLAHSLKGNCATVGADALREECLRLERLCREGALDEALPLYQELIPKFLDLRSLLHSL